MIGALADWFAVAAIFRHPLGLPIPHTAIIPANQKCVAEAIGRFFSEHILTAKVIRPKLEKSI